MNICSQNQTQMKKLILSAALLGFSTMIFAQTPAATPAAPAKAKMEVAKEKAAPQSAVKVAPASSSTPSAAAMKKDGAPDKHSKSAKHSKNDGTSDKRNSEHKEVHAKVPATK